VQPEPVSPELVLVDPELARRERARLEEKAYLKEVLDVAALRRAVAAEPPPAEETGLHKPLWREIATFSRRRLVPAALLGSLLANGFLVADLVARKGEQATQVAIRMVTLTASTSTTVRSNSVIRTAELQARSTRKVVPTGPQVRSTTKVAATKSPTKASVERKVVSLILSAPNHKLPRHFVDPTTGLVKNNVQVVCTKKTTRSYLCAIRLATDARKKALLVRYRVVNAEKGFFTWYGYRGAEN
jgi:hypothetical protein